MQEEQCSRSTSFGSFSTASVRAIEAEDSAQGDASGAYCRGLFLSFICFLLISRSVTTGQKREGKGREGKGGEGRGGEGRGGEGKGGEGITEEGREEGRAGKGRQGKGGQASLYVMPWLMP